jgi:phosphoribosylglycinamide formyltransferase-1
MGKLPISILASGTGTNFQAIAAAAKAGRLDADIRLLLCNRPGAVVLDKAAAAAVPTRVVDHRRFDSREDFDAELLRLLGEAGVELVVMAGFDRLVTPVLLGGFRQRIINIHPALLPAFRGADAQAQAADYGVTLAGATVHIVDEEVDHGPIIIQAAVPLEAGDDAATVRRRILRQEHRIYPHAIQLFAEGRVRVEGRKVVIDGRSRPGEEALISPPLEDRPRR